MYVEMQKEKYGDDIEDIMFRDKKPYGYKYFSMSVYRGGKQVYKERCGNRCLSAFFLLRYKCTSKLLRLQIQEAASSDRLYYMGLLRCAQV